MGTESGKKVNILTYQIIAKGSLVAVPRASSITLTSTNIGYRFLIIIDPGIAEYLQKLSGELFLRVYNATTFEDVNQAGLYYDNGTNVVHYKAHYYINNGLIYIEFKLRQTAGSFSVTPADALGQSLRWEISNTTITTIPGGGAGGAGSGKYYFFDTISFDKDGNETSSLTSSTVELKSQWAYFPHFVDA